MRLIFQIALVVAFSLVNVGCLENSPAPAPAGSGSPTTSTGSPITSAPPSSPSPGGANSAPSQPLIAEAGSAEKWQQDYERLRPLGAAYIRAIDTRGNGPSGWQDLPQSPELASLQQAGCIVKWGKRFRDAENGTSQYVLAYLPETLEKGGAVLLMDGAVSLLSAQDIKAMLAAQGE